MTNMLLHRYGTGLNRDYTYDTDIPTFTATNMIFDGTYLKSKYLQTTSPDHLYRAFALPNTVAPLSEDVHFITKIFLESLRSYSGPPNYNYEKVWMALFDADMNIVFGFQLYFPGASTDVELQRVGNGVASFTTAISASTWYHIACYSDTTNGNYVFKLMDADKVVLETLTASHPGTAGNIAYAGFYCYDVKNGNFANYVTDYIYVEYVKVNYGTQEDLGPETNNDCITADISILPSEHTSNIDITSRVLSATIDRQINRSDQADIMLADYDGSFTPYITPNSKLKINVGFNSGTSKCLFHGYIPAASEYANKVSVKGKNVTFSRTYDITRFGVNHQSIEPASKYYPDASDRDKKSSDQEDMTLAQFYCQEHSNPYYPYTLGEHSIRIQAFSYITKLEDELVFYDDYTNIDNMECFGAVAYIINGMTGGELGFAGGGSDPKKFVGDSKNDWVSRLSFITDRIMPALSKDNVLPKMPRQYFFCQVNESKPKFMIKVLPDGTSDAVAKTITASQVLNMTKTRTKSTIDISLADGLDVDLGDIIFLDTSSYDLMGYYIITQLQYTISQERLVVKVFLDTPVKVKI